ncbi:MAG: DNA mismatch repair endonuclease MutL [Flavobacteriaceae bacterium]
MQDLIKILPDHVANQIAAGEVVQRPASVVKELMENAIDAGAKKIDVYIKDAGRTLIQVIDDGKGMSEGDAQQAFLRHATSKISKAEDLFALHTNGFRGEALASVAAVAHVELKTKRPEDTLGTQVLIAGDSKIKSQEPISTLDGTSIGVKNLFFNIPARRNFLKSNSVEFRHINDEFQRIALANPKIALSLHHNDSTTFQLNATNLRQRLVAIFGNKIDEKLIPIEESTEVVTLRGFITKATFAKKRRGEQFFFVNGRFIKSSYLNHAVNSAYEGLLQNGQHPSYFLYLDIPPSDIDINIHPTKTEIKFENEQIVYAILKSAVKHSLGQYHVTPSLDFERDSSLDTDYTTASNSSGVTPSVEVNPEFNPFTQNHSYTPPKRETKEHWESLYTDIDRPSSVKDSSPQFESSIDSWEEPKQLELPSEEQSSHSLQINKKYLITTIKSGAILINQNLAHQRIVYEEFLMKITVNELASQQLLFPVELSFSQRETEELNSIKPELTGAGFQFESTDKQTLIVSGIPSQISESQIPIVLEQLLDDLKSELPDQTFGTYDIIAKSFAKSMAMKSGIALKEQEQLALVDQLFACKEPLISPFGKPTYITLDAKKLEQLFNKNL